MGRAQAAQITKQAQANSTADQSNAGAAFTGATKAIGDFSNAIGNYQQGLNNIYGQGGEFQKDSSTMANDVSQAGQKSLQNDLNLNAQRTGENTASIAPTLAEADRQASRDLTSFNAGQDEKRLAALNSGNQFAVGEESKIPGDYSQLYAPSVSGADSSLNTATNANAQNKGFFDQIGTQLGQLATAGTSAYATQAKG